MLAGAQDSHALKSILEQMPKMGHKEDGSGGSNGGGPFNIPATYTKFVKRAMSKVEMMLKLVQTPTDMLAQRFKVMWPDGKGQDLQKVLTMKGP